jgi:hypothetical protein
MYLLNSYLGLKKIPLFSVRKGKFSILKNQSLERVFFLIFDNSVSICPLYCYKSKNHLT